MIVNLSPAQRVGRVAPTVVLAMLVAFVVLALHRAVWLAVAPVLAALVVVGLELADAYLEALPRHLAALLRWYGHSAATIAMLALFTAAAFLFHWSTFLDRGVMLLALFATATFVVGRFVYLRREGGMVVYENGLPPEFNALYQAMEQLVVAQALDGRLTEAQQRQASVALNMLWRTIHDAVQQPQGEYVG